MGLYTDILQPASEVFFEMECHGMPLDEERRARLVETTQGRADALRLKIEAATADFHTKRKAKIGGWIAAREALVASKWEASPTCKEHPEFRGQTRRKTCPGCDEVFRMSAPLRAWAKEVNHAIRTARNKLRVIGETFRADNDHDWRAFLFSQEGLGLKPLEVTLKAKIPSVDDDAIEMLAKQNPEMTILRARVDLKHLMNRLNGPLAVKAEADGCVRFSYSLHRTPNGRVASGMDRMDSEKIRESAGNAQNITEVLRQIYRARPGRKIVHVDQSQVESRVTAWLARERKMTQAFRDGEDLHSLNAAAIFGCEPTEARRYMVRFEGAQVSARHAAKRATHGWDYGMGERKTAAMYGLTIGEARRIRSAYFAAWPGLSAFHAQVVERVNAGGVLTNPYGRKLWFRQFRWNAALSKWETTEREEALAFLPASTVADNAKKQMSPLEFVVRQAGGAFLTMTHDSFTFEVPESSVGDFGRETRRWLETPWPELGEWAEFGPFWCPVDVSVGDNWGERHLHDAECPPDCDRENPDGLEKVAA